MKMSYGYAVEVTPIHTLMLYNAVANDGHMVAPRLVTAVTDNGRTVERFGTETVNRRICSDKTLKLVRRALEGVVEEGTGSMMKNPDFKIAGKTGTAQIAMKNKGYADERGGRDYLATFVGYFPADNPRYSCIVAIKTYHGPGARNSYYGASLAAPAFKAIVERVYALDAEWQTPLTEGGERSVAPVKGGDIQEIRTAADRLAVATDTERRRGWGTVSRDSTHVEVSALTTEAGVMPSVQGMSLKDALYLLESRGLRVRFSGKGRVVSQSVRAGTPIREGDAVTIALRPSGR
ncbi:MAG TPA: penicillin-binding transpeptidase domain-containing protein, partial [Deinococcales bacterium]|nr:penicillin-binding transpeptidase domain-containing protein [Deinococcales bacterium]